MLCRIDVSRNGLRPGKLSIAALVAFSLAACVGSGPPKPETSYRANVKIRMTDASTEELALERVVEFYYLGLRRRSARVDGEPVALIDRPDLRVSWLLDPSTKSFDEVPIGSPKAAIPTAPNPFGPQANAAFEWLGSENTDGVETRKYAVEGASISGYAWFTSDQIPLRFEGVIDSDGSSRKLIVEYSEVERGLQSRVLFEIPPNYAGYENRKQNKRQVEADLEEAQRRVDDQVREVLDFPEIF
jgi:hypothetical protein